MNMKTLKILVIYILLGSLVYALTLGLEVSPLLAVALVMFSPLFLLVTALTFFVITRSTIYRAKCPNCEKRGLSIGSRMSLPSTPRNQDKDDLYDKASEAGFPFKGPHGESAYIEM